jgi:hypothetical protein
MLNSGIFKISIFTQDTLKDKERQTLNYIRIFQINLRLIITNQSQFLPYLSYSVKKKDKEGKQEGKKKLYHIYI